MAEPNVPGKPTKSTTAKLFLIFLAIAVLLTWMTCASFGMPFP